MRKYKRYRDSDAPLPFLRLAATRQLDQTSASEYSHPAAGVVTSNVGGSAASLYATLNGPNRSQVLGAGRALLQLQRRHGNRHVQRLLALAKQRQRGPESNPESAIERGGEGRDGFFGQRQGDHEPARLIQQRSARASSAHGQRLQRLCAECEEENKKQEVNRKKAVQRSVDLAQAEGRHEGSAEPYFHETHLGRHPLGSGALQRQADITKAPAMKCIATAGHGHLPGTDIVFGQSSSDLGGQKAAIAAFARQWIADGSKDDVMVDGWASVEGPQELNWQLSCDRAEAVKAELVRQGVPEPKITTLAHGASNEFSASDLAPNRRAIITRQPTAPGPPPAPETITSQTVALTPGVRTRTTIGVGEEVDLTHAPGAAAWATTAGTLSAANGVTVKLTAPDTAQKVTVTAGTANIVFDVIAPNDVHMDPLAGMKHTKDHADSGIIVQPFLLPDNVNFYNVTYRELNVGANTSGTYSCFGAGTGHCKQPSGGACPDLFMTNTVAAGKGTQAVRADCAYSGDCLEAKPQRPGMLYFAIPYEYKVGTGVYRQFRIVLQMHMLAPDFSTLMSYKYGASGFTTVGAATSAIPGC